MHLPQSLLQSVKFFTNFFSQIMLHSHVNLQVMYFAKVGVVQSEKRMGTIARFLCTGLECWSCQLDCRAQMISLI